MSELSAAEKRVFGEFAHKDAAGNIVEKAIGWVEKEAKQVVTLTQHEFKFNVLVEKAKAWEEHVISAATSDAPNSPVVLGADRTATEVLHDMGLDTPAVEAATAALHSEG